MRKTAFEGLECGRELHRIETGYPLQRLFSTFPDRWPGLGLLLLRLGAGISLICLGVSGFSRALGEPIVIGRHLVATVAGISLLAGLWTPAMGALAAIDELWNAFSMYSSPRGAQWIHLLLVLVTAGVAMLGPGAWSIDARLHGRKRFDLGSRAR
jgi:putative oxidoreductase